MHKMDLVNHVASSAGLSKKDAEAAVNAFIDGITDSLVKDDKVTLIGFGTFSTVKTAARKGRNPQTGKEIKIPAGKKVKFTVGKKLKDSVK